tara:strand:+ start:319 stop:510 length:192 start_codon:yes stop_codon:yes gene_type:complete
MFHSSKRIGETQFSDSNFIDKTLSVKDYGGLSQEDINNSTYKGYYINDTPIYANIDRDRIWIV